MEKIFPTSAARMGILMNIHENPGISISGLIRKSKTSPNIVLGYVNLLADAGAVKDKRLGGRKKAHIRQIYPNTSTETGLAVFSMVEMEKRHGLLKKYPFLKPLQEQLYALLKDTHSFIVVYGSYARMSAEKSSDIDVLAVGSISWTLANRIREVFVTLDTELSLKIETREKFVQRVGDHLHQNIIKEHVILTGEREFLRLVSS